MTRRRDRYVGRFDDIPERGVMTASYDLNIALSLLERLAHENGLLDMTYETRRGEVYLLRDLLTTANNALHESIDPALWVYWQLRRNLADAELVEEVSANTQSMDVSMDVSEAAESVADVLRMTLARRSLLSRSERARARRDVALSRKGGAA
jgi:hypothetical protein